ncbi:MAG: GGDEF-domain containing protein, partial [Marinomonas sp.]
MTDLSILLQSKMPLAAWIIDIENATIPWFNEAAEALLADSLHDIESGRRVINDALQKRLAVHLRELAEGAELPFKWPFTAKDGSQYQVTGSVISLGKSRKGLSVEARPCVSSVALDVSEK